jgi:hypothetical protein
MTLINLPYTPHRLIPPEYVEAQRRLYEKFVLAGPHVIFTIPEATPELGIPKHQVRFAFNYLRSHGLIMDDGKAGNAIAWRLKQ